MHPRYIFPLKESEERGFVSCEAKGAAIGRSAGGNIGARNTHASRLGTERKEKKREAKSLKMHDEIFFIRGPITAAPHLGSTYRARI